MITQSKRLWLSALTVMFLGLDIVRAQTPPLLGIDLRGGINLTITGTTGTVCVIQFTDTLMPSNVWASMAIVQLSTNHQAFQDTSSPAVMSRFYRALVPAPPTNMVFVPPNTFTLGSPVTEAGRSSDEGPQTVVTLTRGFWMAKFPVTQAEYQTLIGSNPSGFPGDSNRPVESVTWLDATNYCAKLTQRELAAGHIPPGSHFRLPTEAEWECTARAGTTTRYYYGDDPGALLLTNHAWYFANSGATTHPVGQKPPNLWGLYDMEGNVWEWCQDWYGPYPGGTETDPQGPASNMTGLKVIRGGAWDAFESDCRSASRMTKAVSPFISDVIIGFRVVLAIDPQ